MGHFQAVPQQYVVIMRSERERGTDLTSKVGVKSFQLSEKLPQHYYNGKAE